jgi:hypothetical protein
MAQFRAGNWRAAVAEIRKSMEIDEDEDVALVDGQN